MLRINISTIIIIASIHLNAQDLDYPDLYKSLNLPEYPNATITELGRNNANLRDGIKIYLESAADYAALRRNY